MMVASYSKLKSHLRKPHLLKSYCYVLLASVPLVLGACTTVKIAPPAVEVAPFLRDCPSPIKLPERNLTGAELALALVQSNSALRLCSARLTKVLKIYEGTQE